jgi:hypothetical protein
MDSAFAINLIRGYLMITIGNRQFIEVEIYGKRYLAKVLKVHPFGTVDVELSSGKCFRVSGLKVKEVVA